MDILLVDDSKTMRLLVLRAIRQAGYRGLAVGEAANGEEALQVLDSSVPKLVLCDWNMPEMSGIDFLKKLRGSGRNIPFGFITSERSSQIKDLALKNGALFLITKPFDSEEVQTALEPVLGGY